MSLIPWKRGRSLVWDFTCADTFAPSYLGRSSVCASWAAKKAEERKNTRYAFLQPRFIFVPVAVETSGVWGEEGLRLIKAIGERVARVSGEPRSTSFLVQRVSIAVQRGNVASILGTLPSGRELEEIFLL